MGQFERIDNIEQFEDMEVNFSIYFEGLNIVFETIEEDALYVKVMGEIHSSTGPKLEQDIDIVVTAFSENGEVIGTGSQWFDEDAFLNLAPLDIYVEVMKKPTKVRIYPKLG